MAGGGIGEPPRREVVLRRLVEFRDCRKRSTVNCRHVAEGTDLSPKQVAPTLSALEDEGYLEAWGSSTPQTYFIRLPDGFEPPTTSE